MKLQAGNPFIHEFQGKSVDKGVDALWETGPGGGKLNVRSVPHIQELPGY